MDAKISVRKNVKLEEGEELMDFVNKVMDAVSTHRQKTQRSVFLRGIFKGFIITRDFESGKFFQHKLGRDKEGLVKLGDPVEVRQTFVPVASKAAVEKGEGDEFRTVEMPAALVMLKGEKLTQESTELIESVCADIMDADTEDDFVTVEKSGDVIGSLFSGII